MMTALPPPATTSAAVSRPNPLLPPTTTSFWPAKFVVISGVPFCWLRMGQGLPPPLRRTSSGHLVVDELSWLHGVPRAFADADGYPGTRAGQRPELAVRPGRRPYCRWARAPARWQTGPLFIASPGARRPAALCQVDDTVCRPVHRGIPAGRNGLSRPGPGRW